MKTSKAFSPSIRHFRTIPRSMFAPHNRVMEQHTIAELLEEIDDLHALLRNRDLQLTWAKQQNLQLRARLARYESELIGVAA
jgi:hypothetical protein